MTRPLWQIWMALSLLTALTSCSQDRSDVEREIYEHQADIDTIAHRFALLTDAFVAESYHVSMYPCELDHGITLILISSEIRDYVPVVNLGGTCMHAASAEMSEVLEKLGCEQADLEAINSFLTRHGYQGIHTLGNPKWKAVNIRLRSTWSGTYHFYVFEPTVPDSLIHELGKPIGSDSFGRRVVLDWDKAIG